MDDHYFGQIKERVAAFMQEVDEELWKLGVLAKTKHNEVAPAQHEIAPIFSTTNISSPAYYGSSEESCRPSRSILPTTRKAI